ncbi:MAG: ArsR/SmtB family transcription factor [Chloroflexota bacterium]
MEAIAERQVEVFPAELAAKFFRGLGDPTRLRIVLLLLEGEKNVGELVALTNLSQGRVSTHLTCLRWCGYVCARRVGRNVHYRVADPRVRELVLLAQGIIADNASNISCCQIIK